MKSYLIDRSIGGKELKNFLEFTDLHPDDPWDIYIQCPGGQVLFTDCIRFKINNHKPGVRLICMSAYSSAFHLFYLAEVEKILIYGAMGMIHLGSVKLDINSKQRPTTLEDAAHLRNGEFISTVDDEMSKKICTPSELELFQQDRDVYFDFKRMKQIFPLAKVFN